SGSTFAVGTSPVTCTATDADGNTHSDSFNVTVTRSGTGGDTQPPVIQISTNIISGTDLGQCSAVVNFTVAVTDNHPGVVVVCTPPSGSVFPKGVTTVVCVATDAVGNKATNSFTVTVVDRENPALQLPADITVTVDPSATGAPVSYTVTATDNCSTPTLVCAPASGSTFAVGTSPVTCTATDADGNTHSGSFNVTVTRSGTGGDTQPPVIQISTNIISGTDLGQCSAVVNFSVV